MFYISLLSTFFLSTFCCSTICLSTFTFRQYACRHFALSTFSMSTFHPVDVFFFRHFAFRHFFFDILLSTLYFRHFATFPFFSIFKIRIRKISWILFFNLFIETFCFPRYCHKKKMKYFTFLQIYQRILEDCFIQLSII
jgi:hypothetical protein